jgi:short-subunit dehydrogenase
MTLPLPSASSTCLVTGASSGIGADIARELARRGRGLVLVARRADRLETLAGELREGHGTRVEVLPADLTDPSARAGLWEAVEGLGLQVDVLVNNAGFSTIGRVAEADVERELAMVRTDVEAVVDLTTRALPGMAARGGGGVLNVASTAAFQPIPGQAGYGASKAFVLSYSYAIRQELRSTGVAVTALCPGPVSTEFGEATGKPSIFDFVPGLLMSRSPDVARAAVEGLEADRAVVVPGVGNRISSLAGTLTPRTLLMPVLGRFYPALRDLPEE